MGKKQHLSRLSAPKSWPIKRKGIKWVMKPSPGPHTLETAMPLGVILKEVLKLTSTNRESKKVLNNGQILVNGKIQKDIRFPVGLLDIISIPAINKHYRVLIGQNQKLKFVEIPSKEANILLLKIKNKTTLRKKRIQLNFTNGWNLLVPKDIYATGDVVVFDVNKKQIIDRLKLEKGVLVYFLKGKHAGSIAKFLEIKKIGKLKKEHVAVVERDGDKWETLAKNLIVVGKSKPVINLEGK